MLTKKKKYNDDEIKKRNNIAGGGRLKKIKDKYSIATVHMYPGKLNLQSANIPERNDLEK